MDLGYLQNKKIGILGLGIENYALVKFLLSKKLKAEITICDARDMDSLGEKFSDLVRHENIRWQLERAFNRELHVFDILFRAPGWPIACPGIQRSIKAKKKINPKFETDKFLYSPIKLFMDLCPTENTIGVTGTKGKGTTASLITAILEAAGKKVWLGGNIGVAPFDFLPKIKSKDWVVLELSSFQLEDMHKSPRIAVITNFYSEHLAPADPLNPNYHKSLKSYWEAKKNIFRYQTRSQFAVLNNAIKRRIVKAEVRGNAVYFDRSKLPSRLLGEHNQENIAAAQTVAQLAGIKAEFIKNAVAGFQGLEHRLEYVADIKGAAYYNDSFATTPESTITALKSFKQPIILLAGGADKGANFNKLAKEIKRKVKFSVLLEGEATPRIKEALIKVGIAEDKFKIVSSIGEAVALASSKAIEGDIVLLSTACASFGMFRNYKERGQLFKEEVKKIVSKTK